MRSMLMKIKSKLFYKMLPPNTMVHAYDPGHTHVMPARMTYYGDPYAAEIVRQKDRRAAFIAGYLAASSWPKSYADGRVISATQAASEAADDYLIGLGNGEALPHETD
jgi:hypothetical protein